MAEEATAVNEPVVQDTTSTDSAPVETASTEVVSDLEAADKAVTESLAKAETESQEDAETKAPEIPAEETQTEDQPKAKGYEARKEQLSGDITSLVAQRNQLRQEVEQLTAQAYQPATEQELQDQGYSPEMAAIESFKQEQAIRDYNTQVADKQLELRSEAQSIVRDFPELSPITLTGEPNPDYNEVLGSQLDTLLAQNLQVDQNTGQIVGSTIPPYQLYKLVADAARTSEQAGQIKGQQAAERQLANADTTSSATPARETEDDLFMKGLRS